MSTDRRPSTLDGIGSLARELRRGTSITHTQALNLAAQRAGFENYRHAQNVLGRRAGQAAAPPPVATAEEFPFPGRSDFHARSLRRWITAVRHVNPSQAASVAWSHPARITEMLRPFLGQNHNHAHLPTGGGHDVLDVKPSTEAGCLELQISKGLAYIVRPARLTLEVIASAPGESFLLLELAPLARTEAYDPSEGVDQGVADRIAGSEELVELAPGDYAPRWHWDENRGPDDEPLAEDARLVVRWMGGKILFVAKGSLWNGASFTYDGVHNVMTLADIRHQIERRALRAA